MQEATILSRKHTADGELLVGKENNNPLLDTRVYTVQFPDGSKDECAEKMILESLCSNIDEEGYTYSLISGIFCHKKDETALPHR